MTDTALPSTFERFLFTCTRVFALVAGALCLVGVVGSVFLLFTLFDTSGTHVSYADVQAVAEAPSGSDEADNVAIPGVALPANVQLHLVGNNRKILRGWLDGLDADQKKDFLQNMSEVIQVAEQSDVRKTLRGAVPGAVAEQSAVDIVEAINKYKTLKLQKLATNSIERYAIQVRRGAVIGLIAFMVLVLATSSLGLVLLSIERNTRRLASHGA